MSVYRSDRLVASNALCGSRPTRDEVCRTPLASLVDSPDPFEVRRGEGIERQRKSAAGEGRGSQRYVRHERERERERERNRREGGRKGENESAIELTETRERRRRVGGEEE